MSQDELSTIRAWASRLATTLILPKAVHFSEKKLDKDFLKALHAEGLMTLSVPESEGGAGLSSQAYAATIEEISKASGAVGVTVSVTNMIADVLMREGTAHHREKFLKQLIDGRSLTASFCLTENHSGSDASAMRTFAKKVSGGYETFGRENFRNKWSIL